MKNHAGKLDYKYNTPDAEHLDPSFPWPGQESNGVINPGKWYCVEFAYFRSNTDGWIKAWIDEALVINASRAAWGVDSYDTDAGYAEDFVQIPAYRNGGVDVDHYEYIDDFALSSQRIGCS